MTSYDLTGKVILITGATSGFGKIVASDAASRGARVFATSRDVERGNQLIEFHNQRHPHSKGWIETIDCDLGSFDSITKACRELRARVDKIDMLVNNAGLWNFHFRETADKIEETFQVNLLAPLLLSHLLIDMLGKSSDPKLIFTTSGLHQGTIKFDNIEFRKRFVGYKSYRQSKLGVILVTRHLARELESKGIGVYCQHPGMIRTNLARDAGWFIKRMFRLFTKPVEEGTKTLRYLIETPKKNLESGEYYADLRVNRITPESYDMNMALRLMLVSRGFLQPWIENQSFIFP